MSFTSDTLVFPVELPGSKTLSPEPFLVELAIYLQKVSFTLSRVVIVLTSLSSDCLDQLEQASPCLDYLEQGLP